MDMYQKRKLRKEKKEQNLEDNKSFSNVRIHWYPGHMAKTRRLIKEKYNLIDVVYELIDARIPYSSKIKDVDDLLKDKPRILIMNKYDLCDQTETNKWVKIYEEQGYKVVKTNLTSNNAPQEVINATNELMESLQQKRLDKGLKEKEIRVLVMGIPNVGKSTLINRLSGRNAVNTGNTPGVTKSLNFIKTNTNILLLDSPGILWPKIDNEKVGLNLASMTAIKMEILPVDDVAIHILKNLETYYPEILKSRYNLDQLDEDFCIVYDTIGKKIGALISGGEVDYDRVSNTILNDIKNEYIKGITFDRTK